MGMLDGKTAVVTGAGRGIGRGLALHLAREGAGVVVNDPGGSVRGEGGDLSVAEQVAEEIRVGSGRAMASTDSVATWEGARAIIQTAMDHFGRVDILINNAGIYPASDTSGFGHTNYAEWMTAFNINTMAPLKMAEAFAQHITRSKKKSIVTLTSLMASIADNSSGGSYLYRSSKAAANMVVKSLAVDLRQKGITSVAFHPGWVQTDMGGPNAMIPAAQSVSGMRKVISNLTLADSGKFFDYEGHVLPW